jgi:hypothetical protein
MEDLPQQLLYVDFRLQPILISVAVLAVVLYFVRKAMKSGD